MPNHINVTYIDTSEQKEYLVTTIDKVRTIYVVPAHSQEEARLKIAHPEASYHIDYQEFHDLDEIVSVEENI